MKRFLTIVGFITLVSTAFYVAISLTNSKSTDHAYDTIVRDNNSSPFRASARNRILRDHELRTSLNLTGEQKTKLDQIFENYDEQHTKFYENWKQKNPDAGYYVPFAAKGSREWEVDICRRATSILSNSQVNKLFQAEYRLASWSFVFLDEVQKELRLTESQIQTIKDLHVEAVGIRNKLYRKLMASTPEQRPALKQQAEEKIAALKLQFENVLTAEQKRVCDHLLGRKSAPTVTTAGKAAAK